MWTEWGCKSTNNKRECTASIDGCYLENKACIYLPLCKTIQELTKDGKFNNALKLQNELYEISTAMFCETNPVPVKYALYKLGIFKSDECRLPLITLSQKSKDLVDKILLKYNK